MTENESTFAVGEIVTVKSLQHAVMKVKMDQEGAGYIALANYYCSAVGIIHRVVQRKPPLSPTYKVGCYGLFVIFLTSSVLHLYI